MICRLQRSCPPLAEGHHVSATTRVGTTHASAAGRCARTRRLRTLSAHSPRSRQEGASLTEAVLRRRTWHALRSSGGAGRQAGPRGQLSGPKATGSARCGPPMTSSPTGTGRSATATRSRRAHLRLRVLRAPGRPRPGHARLHRGGRLSNQRRPAHPRQLDHRCPLADSGASASFTPCRSTHDGT